MVEIRLEMDPNRRSRDGYVPVSFRGLPWMPEVAEPVIVTVSEDGIEADGVAVRIDHDRAIVYINVDWDSMRETVDG